MKHLKLIIAVLTVVLATQNMLTAQNQEQNKPNILWITSEDNSADWIHCYGNKYSETPNIDKLANEGFQYMNAYANAPVCAAQRNTWITGVYGITMGTHNMRSFYDIPDEIKYYPEFLEDNGYYRGNFKKRDYNIGRDSEYCWNSIEKPDWDELKQKQPFFQIINLGSSHESTAFGDVYNTDHDPKKTTLREFHPDVPGMRENYAHYHDAIKKMDSEVGMHIKEMEKMGLSENTIVIYCSDHGGVLPRSKRFLFAPSLHCPVVIRIPEQYKELYPAKKPGSKVDRLMSFIDMPKTWLSITNSTVPEYMQGQVFLGDNTEEEQEYHFAFRGRMDEQIDNARAINDKRYLLIRNYMPHLPWMQYLDYLWQMEATKAWVNAIDNGVASDMQSSYFLPKNHTEELYDMKKDPNCTINLIDNPKYAKTAARLRVAMRKKQIEVIDAGLLPERDMDKWARDNNTTMYELVRNPELYNIEEVLNAADMALEKDKRNLDKLHAMLNSKSVAIRYYGMLGCFLLDDISAGTKLINDDYHEIRILAAWNMVKTGNRDKGINCLKEMIEGDSYAMLSLFNTAIWLGDDGKELMSAINNVEVKNNGGSYNKYQRRHRNYLNTLHKQ